MRRSSGSADNAGSRQVEPRKRRRTSPSDLRRKAARRAEQHTAIVHEIERVAHERHEAYVDSEPHPNVIERTTGRLEELFDDRRGEQAGTLTDEFRGKTMQAGRS